MSAAGPPSAASWVERDGLFVEPRLAALGLRHGFAARRLGDMKDPAAAAAAAAAAGLAAPKTLRQVHGTTVRLAREPAGQDGDGWVLDRPGVCVGVYAADCLPLYLWSEDGAAAGVFHAGWRGTAAGMARAAVAALGRAGAAPGRLFAAAGPHAGACCYRVGPELEGRFPAASFASRGGELFLDLAAETRRQLLDAGLAPQRVAVAAPCTVCRPEDFHSFRRDKRDARMLAFLALGERL